MQISNNYYDCPPYPPEDDSRDPDPDEFDPDEGMIYFNPEDSEFDTDTW